MHIVGQDCLRLGLYLPLPVTLLRGLIRYDLTEVVFGGKDTDSDGVKPSMFGSLTLY